MPTEDFGGEWVSVTWPVPVSWLQSGPNQVAVTIGRTLPELGLEGLVEVTGVRRRGVRSRRPDDDWRFEAGDAVVLLGRPESLLLAERRLLER